jgi:hypothetical protein
VVLVGVGVGVVLVGVVVGVVLVALMEVAVKRGAVHCRWIECSA